MSYLRRHAKPLILLLIVDVLWMARVIRPIEGQAIGAHDMRGLFYPWLEFAHNTLWRGELPLWDSAHFAGYPFLANPQVALFYPPTWLTLLFPVNLGISLYLILHLWIAGAGIYLLITKNAGQRAMSDSSQHKTRFSQSAINDYLPLISAFTFMFSGFFMARIYAGHIGFLAVHAWMGWLLLGVDYMLRRPTVQRAAIASIPLGMVVLAGHTTSLLYVGLLWLSYALFQSTKYKNGWLLVVRQLFVASAVALLLAAVQLIPTAQLILLSARSAESGYEFATRFSLPLRQLLTLIVPDLFGKPTTVGYWGAETFEELTGYVGLLPLLVLPFALRWRSRRTLFWLAVAIFGLLLSLGEQGVLHRVLYELLPPFRLTRAPARGLFFFTFAMSMLLGETLPRLQSSRVAFGRRYFGTVLSLTAIASALWLLNWQRLGQLPAGDQRNRLVYQLDSSLLIVLLIVSGGILLWSIFRPIAIDSKWSIPSSLLVLLLGAFVLMDLGNFGRNLVRRESITPPAYWTAAANMIGTSSQRVLPWGVNLFDQNHPSQVGLNSVFGYNTLELAANSQLYSQATDPRSPIYDLFAADFVVAPVELAQFAEGENGLTLVGADAGAWVYKRVQPLPIAWLESATVQSNRLIRPAEVGSAVVVEQGMGFWRIEVNSDVAARLVLSEVDYPGWRVTVDGVSAEIVPAYDIFKAVEIPEGSHTAEFRFVPTLYIYGLALSILALIGIGLTIMKLGLHKIETESASS